MVREAGKRREERSILIADPALARSAMREKNAQSTLNACLSQSQAKEIAMQPSQCSGLPPLMHVLGPYASAPRPAPGARLLTVNTSTIR